MNIYKKYQDYAISIVGRKDGYITQAEREKARKKKRNKKKRNKRNRTMSKAKVKYIPIDIYKRCIYIFIGSLDKFKLWVKNTYIYDEEKDFVNMVLGLTEDSIGMASFNWDSAGGTGAVLIPKMPKTPKETASLIHELMHATFWVLDLCHVDYDPNGSNEAFTYVMEHLTRNALEKEGYEEVEFKI